MASPESNPLIAAVSVKAAPLVSFFLENGAEPDVNCKQKGIFLFKIYLFHSNHFIHSMFKSTEELGIPSCDSKYNMSNLSNPNNHMFFIYGTYP